MFNHKKIIFILLLILFISLPLNLFAKDTYNNFGYLIYKDKNFTVWWAEATYKIFKEQKLPSTKTDRIKIFAAKNEYEPFQLVINSRKNLNKIWVSPNDFKSNKVKKFGGMFALLLKRPGLIILLISQPLIIV